MNPYPNMLVIDLETTGEAPPAAVVEIGAWMLRPEFKETPGPWVDSLVAPAPGIESPPEIMAVHHITAEDLTAGHAFDTFVEALSDGGIAAYVAHNAAFEQKWIGADITKDRPWICTMKCAMRAWPHFPKFSNQALRYLLGTYKVRRDYCNNAHRAAPDAFVTALTLFKLLEFHPFDQLVAWTRDIMVWPRINFGMHEGTAWSNVPAGYLNWMLKQADMDPDKKECARRALRGELK